MSVLIARDSSTLKVLRKNSKVCESCCVIYSEDDCEHCEPGKTPAIVNIVVNGMTNCGCVASGLFSCALPCALDWGYMAYETFGDISSKINGQKISMIQGGNCWWYGDLLVSNCGLRVYCQAGPVDCEDLPEPYETITFTKVRYSIIRYANNIYISLIGIPGPLDQASAILVAWNVDCSGDSSCVECTGDITLDGTPCAYATTTIKHILIPGSVVWWD